MEINITEANIQELTDLVYSKVNQPYSHRRFAEGLLKLMAALTAPSEEKV